jgi:hypothetical protein
MRVWRCVVQSRAGQHLKHGQLLLGTSMAGGGTWPEIVYECAAWLVMGSAHVRTREGPLDAAGASWDARLAKNLTKFGRPPGRWLPLHRPRSRRTTPEPQNHRTTEPWPEPTAPKRGSPP